MVPTLALIAALVATPSVPVNRLTGPPTALAGASAAPPAPAAEAHAALTHAAIAAFMIGQFTDITTTEYGIGAGKIREANPLFRAAVKQGPVVAGVAKGTFAVAVSWVLLRAHRGHPKATFATAVLLTAAQGYVTWHNAQLLR